MENHNGTRQPMPELPPLVRSKNFEEVALGYTREQALDEAARCLQCKKAPCVGGCPVQIRIPEFIKKIKEEDFEGAYQIISASSSLPAVCGRVCPQERQCEGRCVRGIKGEPVAIGRLERFVADWHFARVKTPVSKPESNGIKVAVVGSGPAGLTCAGELARRGYEVTVFEALHIPGGVLVYGIPEFRLPKAIVAKEIAGLKALGVKIETNMVIGRVLSIDDLFEEGFQGIFIGSGAGLPQFLGIPGENLRGVFSANEFLTRVNLMKAYQEDSDTPIWHGKKVAVIGGGNVAMDAARSAKRLGAEEVYILYRRSMEEIPARAEEIHHAMEEGIQFKTLTRVTEIFPDEQQGVARILCVEMELGDPDERGRRIPVEKPNTGYMMEMDAVIVAIGTSPNPLIRTTTPGLNTNPRGCIITEEESGKTSRDGVFAGGDVVTGAATVILAMGAGKNAARAMDEELKKAKK